MARKFISSAFCVALAYACAFAWEESNSAKAATADWTVTISTSVVNRCLQYPDSKLYPLIRSSIYFQQGVLESSKEEKEMERRGAEQDIAVPETLYENQYSSHFRAVGLHRFQQLIIKPGTPGTIKITTSNSSLRHEEVNAAANATLRLILDLYLNKMSLRSVTVPREIFDLYVQELQRYGFRSANVVPGQTISALLPLSVRSEPAGRSIYLTYGM